MTKQNKRFCVMMTVETAKILFSAYFAWVNSLWLMPSAQSHMGIYEAATVCIIGVFVLTYFAVTALTDRIFETRRNK